MNGYAHVLLEDSIEVPTGSGWKCNEGARKEYPQVTYHLFLNTYTFGRMVGD